MNRFNGIGRLTKEPDMRSTANGTSVCTFTLAINRRFKTEGQQQADFIPIVAWGKTADICAKYLHKGSQVAVCGSIQTRSYDDKNGNKVYVTEANAEEVQFLTPKSNEAENNIKMAHEMFDGQMTPAEDEEIPF
ncbi:MAG: single-stranded DNA-binding protein [Bacteroidales bacterium]|nr:single-stranded DNA-binding protein [Bacteroidales bacterium]